MILSSPASQRGQSALATFFLVTVVAVLVLLVLWGRDSEESKLAQIAAQQERYEQTLREELAVEKRKKRDGFEEEKITSKDVEAAIREGSSVLSFEPPVDLIEPEKISEQELSEADELKAEADKLVEQMEALIADNGLFPDEPSESISAEELDRIKTDFVGAEKELQELQELSESVDE